MGHFADIILPTAVRHPFTYAVRESLVERIRPGLRVWIPFQKHKAIGMVVKVHQNEPDFKTRSVEKIMDEQPVLSDELLELTEWIHRFYYCGWGEVVQAALPVGLNFYAEKYLKATKVEPDNKFSEKQREILEEIGQKESYTLKEARKRWGEEGRSQPLKKLIDEGYLEVWEEPEMKMKPATRKLWKWKGSAESKTVANLIEAHREEGHDYKWIQALELLQELGLPEFQDNLLTFDLLDYYTLNRIADEGLIQAEEVEHSDITLKFEHDPSQLTKLNREQEQAFEAMRRPLDEGKYQSFLLYGVTGSGKTEVYIHALKRALEEGRGGLVLVPEIGLTPQIVERFYRIFGDDIAVLHSRLTDRERYDAWHALRQGEKRIAIGARSAVFAPVQNLGLIVVDEEHDASYKQEDPAPRYNARDVAVMRATMNNAVVVMGSATPSLVALQATRKGKSTLLSLTERPLEAKLPKVKVLDLKQYRSAMSGPLAIPLYEAVKEGLKREEQAILLYNRRGYASFLHCGNCGDIPECPNCSVSLTYHKAKRQLRCHYCGYAGRIPRQCSSCGHDDFEAIGSGTQQLEEQIEELFPEARLLRMDFDTTAGRGSHAHLLNKFARKEADILVGTQMVGKGLDFQDVTVVGVINADTELAFPSFRSGERMFQLLSQVAGRSGRAVKEGRVYFQTWQSDHHVIEAAKKHDYRSFARRELGYRKSLSYPPYSRIIRFIFKGQRERKVQQVAEIFTSGLVELLEFDDVLGPSPATILRMQRYYRWESMAKIDPGKGAGAIERLLDRAFALFEEKKPEGASAVRINVNVDALE